MPESETHLLDRLHEALHRNPHLFGRKLGFAADSGVVVLTGTVNSYFEKQMAQEAIRRIDGVALIDNRLQVDWDSAKRASDSDPAWGLFSTFGDHADYRGFGGVPMTASVTES